MNQNRQGQTLSKLAKSLHGPLCVDADALTLQQDVFEVAFDSRMKASHQCNRKVEPEIVTIEVATQVRLQHRATAENQRQVARALENVGNGETRDIWRSIFQYE